MNELIIVAIPFIVCWPVAVYLFWRWDIGGYRSEYESRKKNQS
jgi:hypothetical protein